MLPYDIPDTAGGYYRHPTIFEDQVIFVSEDDLWTVPLAGGVARRLTGAQGQVTSPEVSPDGKYVAYTSTEHGCPEVFVMPTGGGTPQKLTFSGATIAEVCGWSPDGEYVIFRSSLREPFRRTVALYRVPFQGGELERMSTGQAHRIAYSPDGQGVVLARYTDDLARWKRYRGGTAGQLWIDRRGSGQWERLLEDSRAGMCRPMWIDDRIYFITDRDGSGNLYSCDLDGGDLQQHTDHEGHYVRFASHHGSTIVYILAGELYRFDISDGSDELLEVEYRSPRPQRAKKFVDAEDYLFDHELHPRGHSLTITSRGKVFNFGNWEGAVRQTGQRFGVRYRLACYIGDGDKILVVSDEDGEERFELHDADADQPIQVLELVDDGGNPVDPGRPVDLKISPDGTRALAANHRFEVLHIDLENSQCTVVDKSPAKRIAGIAWAPDSRHVAYGFFQNQSLSLIKIADLHTGQRKAVTSGEFRDIEPSFDPKGRYLYFLSYRHFDPVMDQMYFDLSFPQGVKPCVVTLARDTESPFIEHPRPLDDSASDGDGDGDNHDREDEEKEEETLTIDYEDIFDRVEVFPVPEGNYDQLEATDERVFWTIFPMEKGFDDPRGGTLKYWDLEKKKSVTFARGVASFVLDRRGKTMALWTDDLLRVVSAGGDGPDEDDEDPGRESGVIDLERVTPAVDPAAEWHQMLREAWRLMRDQFWRPDMSGVDWESVWERYKLLLPRVSARSEFSDLVWTMQGELGTSHAYEVGGDYEIPPQYQPGFLGADLRWDPQWRLQQAPERFQGAFRIERILRGDPWEKKSTSPLLRPGTGLRRGDVIVAVNGQYVSPDLSMGELLASQAGREVELLVARGDGTNLRSVTVATIGDEQSLRYREWVALNRRTVHEATEGKIGYVHIPNMGSEGYAEFHRQYLREHSRQGLIVDVRVNGGGFVSQLILEKLARKPMGLELIRHGCGKGDAYPAHAVDGPLVALTDATAGSDGDVFSHCFKLMELGPLVGTRTWGGTIGIWPRHALADGSVTTQPEYAFWFKDIGFGLENHGAEPDIVVDMPPDTAYGADDPQLQRAIDEALVGLQSASPLTLPEDAMD